MRALPTRQLLLRCSTSCIHAVVCLLLTSIHRSNQIALISVQSMNNVQISRGKTLNCHCVDVGFIKTYPSADGRLSGHVPTGLEYVTPQIQFLYIIPQFRLKRLILVDWASFRPYLTVTPLPFSWPSALRIPGRRTCTSLVQCHARHTRLSYVWPSNSTGSILLLLKTTVPASLSCHPCFRLSIPTHIKPRSSGNVDT